MNAITLLTKNEIIKLAEESKSIREIFKKIGIKSYNSTYYYKVFKARCKKLNLELSKFLRNNEKQKRKQISDEQIKNACKNNTCGMHVLKSLGLNQAGSNARWLKKKKYELDINTVHWTKKSSTKAAIRKNTIPIGEILIENSTYLNTDNLKKRLIKIGLLKYKCCKCGIDKWCDKPITLQLDHKNGINNDNRLENIRLLCPNCHSQTKTFCGKNTSPQRNGDKFDYREIHKTQYICNKCYKSINASSLHCRSCAPRKTKINWPSDAELLKILSKSNFYALGKKLGVSDNAIRKRLKSKNLI